MSGAAVSLRECVVCRVNLTPGLQCSACREAAPASPVALVTEEGRVRTADPARADVPESEEQEAIRAELLADGWEVWRVGQRDARGTQDPGVSDLFAVHRARRLLVFVEVKRPDGGVESEPQAAFGAAVKAVGGPVSYVCGALPHVRLHLSTLQPS